MNDDPGWTLVATPWVSAGLVSPATANCWLWRVNGIWSTPGYGEAENEVEARAAVERCMPEAGVLTAHQAASLARRRPRDIVERLAAFREEMAGKTAGTVAELLAQSRRDRTRQSAGEEDTPP